MGPNSPSYARWSALAALGVLTVLVYADVRTHEFLSFDDTMYVTENVYVTSGLTPATVAWALVDTRAAHYWHPLTWISHMVDVELFGLTASRHLAMNVALHLLATYLLCAALFDASGRFWESFVVAALFALHPQHVESVAWVSERKDVLSTVFWCLTMILYVWYARRPSFARLAAAFGAFVFGVMAKPFVVVLPAALLLLDYWPLRRAPFSPRGDSVDRVRFPTASTLRLLFEKVPFFAVSTIVVVLTLGAADLGSMFEEERFPLSVTAANAARSTVLYIVRTLWPANLAAFYPHPGTLPTVTTAACALVLAAGTATALFFGRTRPHLIVGWLWYLGTLLPVAQVIQQSRHGMADRYTYVPLIGIFVAAVWEASEQLRRRRAPPAVVAITTTAVLAAFSILSWIQVSYWKDTETLFRRAIAVTEDNYVAHGSLGAELLRTGKTGPAEAHLREAIRIRPTEPNSLANLGLLLAARGENREAIALLQESARLRPWRETAWYGLALIYEDQGRLRAAERHYRRAIRANRFSANAHFRLGLLLERRSETSEAAKHLRRALALDPTHVEAREALARLPPSAEP